MLSQRIRRYHLPLVLALLLVICVASSAAAQGLPKVSIGIEDSDSPSDLSVTLKIILLLTILSLAPSIVITMTSFTRIIVVLSFLKHALGTQQMPPAQLLVGLALILSFFIMAPVFSQAYEEGIKPYTEGTIDRDQAYERGIEPIREFMLKQTREKDLALFVRLAGLEKPTTHADVPLRALLPGFVISELRVAFQIGFVLFIPFLIIDMVVASVLMSMGMLMLPPIMVAMPFKILLFVLVDGWYLVVQSLVGSFY
ncbi:MAG: flagellar type III secretion system pore protein FliP [candidate division Zixibacteria bacterium]|nr:flagellar type III secretion system pore protein FliP [candidate division Zixibacteria bacterium]